MYVYIYICKYTHALCTITHAYTHTDTPQDRTDMTRISHHLQIRWLSRRFPPGLLLLLCARAGSEFIGHWVTWFPCFFFFSGRQSTVMSHRTARNSCGFRYGDDHGDDHDVLTVVTKEKLDCRDRSFCIQLVQYWMYIYIYYLSYTQVFYRWYRCLCTRTYTQCFFNTHGMYFILSHFVAFGDWVNLYTSKAKVEGQGKIHSNIHILSFLIVTVSLSFYWLYQLPLLIESVLWPLTAAPVTCTCDLQNVVFPA